ncbi:hypothetical protein K4L06_04735 [Lysobacter sp. BMK333-48F3]|uniref:hypothetical protein n=1 Tax=Lysobacter sp. BMK333-48F3 TaxID=2867962 RepID=UPI001C8B933E|nr:hypothetical protein [Lysobacter sp. BMK333-48F3]MBX9400608.1 hypothetical protein [Lysobacter sp. BMK333-48F3]
MDQVTIKLGEERPRNIVSLIEGRLTAHGFERYNISHPDAPGSPLEARFYEGKGNAHANIYIESGDCVGFVTLVDPGEKDMTRVKALFADVRNLLKQNSDLSFTIGDCSNPPEKF